MSGTSNIKKWIPECHKIKPDADLLRMALPQIMFDINEIYKGRHSLGRTRSWCRNVITKVIEAQLQVEGKEMFKDNILSLAEHIRRNLDSVDDILKDDVSDDLRFSDPEPYTDIEHDLFKFLEEGRMLENVSHAFKMSQVRAIIKIVKAKEGE